MCVAFYLSFLFYSIDRLVFPSQWTPQHSISVGCSADRAESRDKRPGVAQTYQVVFGLSCVGFWGLVSSLAKLGCKIASHSISTPGVLVLRISILCIPTWLYLVNIFLFVHWSSQMLEDAVPWTVVGADRKGQQTDALLKEAFIMQWWRSVRPAVRKTWVPILVLPLLVFELGKVL